MRPEATISQLDCHRRLLAVGLFERLSHKRRAGSTTQARSKFDIGSFELLVFLKGASATWRHLHDGRYPRTG